LKLVTETVGDRPVNAARPGHPGRWNKAVVELRPIDAVELGRLMVLIVVADRYEIDTGGAPVELIDNLEINPELLDFRGAMQLVIGIEPRACVFELDLGVEDDVVGDRIRRQQHNSSGIEAILPLARSE